MPLDRKTFVQAADYLALALAVSLPWSTSATGILAVVWLLAVIPTLELRSLRRVVLLTAGGLPVLLVALGAVGMLWADVSWAERFGGVTSFLKLLFIPLLMHQYSRTGNGRRVLIGFLASCVLLLALSWLMVAWPGFPWHNRPGAFGIPVKDYIAQSTMLTICIFVIVQFAYDMWRDGRRRLALALTALALVCLANVLYVATARTALAVIPILTLVFGYKLSGWKGALGLIVACVVLAAAAWPSSTYLRTRVVSFFHELDSYRSGGQSTSVGERLTYWTKSVKFIETAPVFGHGTGSIKDQFRRSTVGQTGIASEMAANPHNQTFAVGIQLGLVGIALLYAMWIAHLMLFRPTTFAAWVGLVVVIQNVVGSLFNSHLFDFTHGWVYVVGVGIAGGVVLKESMARTDADPGHA